jgi:hypothetical protein
MKAVKKLTIWVGGKSVLVKAWGCIASLVHA